MKGILVNEEGDASLEDLSNSVAPTDDLALDPEGSKSSNKKVSLCF
jgi:DNA helicase INO80